MKQKLNSGDGFPPMTLHLTGGGMIDVPSAPTGGYQIVLFYRGSF